MSTKRKRKAIEWLKVDSSNIEAVSYADEQLRVLFLGTDAIYTYHDVPQDAFEELMKAESKGAYLNSRIKKAYEFSKRARPWPGFCQATVSTKYGTRKCGAMLNPPDRTDCPTCGASDEDET